MEKDGIKKITYGFYHSPFGEMVLAKTEKGLCWLGFMIRGKKGNGYARMKKFFPGALLVHDDEAIAKLAMSVLTAWERGREASIKLDLQGTAFQISVWKSLLKIPKGKVCSYSDVANDIARPKAVRAVGGAVGANPVSLIVPCHRVVPRGGGVGNYGWGPKLKENILEAEKN